MERINEMSIVWGEDSPERSRQIRMLETTANGGRESFTKPVLNEEGAIPVGGSFFIPVETFE